MTNLDKVALRTEKCQVVGNTKSDVKSRSPSSRRQGPLLGDPPPGPEAIYHTLRSPVVTIVEKPSNLDLLQFGPFVKTHRRNGFKWSFQVKRNPMILTLAAPLFSR